jgi:hypothetical protein
LSDDKRASSGLLRSPNPKAKTQNQGAESCQKLCEKPSDFQPMSISKSILKKKVHTKLTADMIYQIQRIGNNLNQIAKSLNQKKDSDISNLEVLRKLIEIEKAIKEISNDR